jgi:hypothetical protein
VRPRVLALTVAATLAVAAGCSLGGGTLGGREKCWPAQPPRAASIWRGTLAIDASGAQLDTPEGEAIPLVAGSLTPRVGPSGAGELVAGETVVARSGDDVTLFGGAGADGFLVVCGVEEIHSGS